MIKFFEGKVSVTPTEKAKLKGAAGLDFISVA